MSKIIIDNVEFDFDNGCRLLKLKNGDDCPFPQLEDFWGDVEPLTFKEIAQFENLEKRRIGINHLCLERLIESVKPTLVDTKTLKKTTSWVNENGEFVKPDYGLKELIVAPALYGYAEGVFEKSTGKILDK